MYSADAVMWVKLPLATRHKAVRYNPRFPSNGVKNLPTGQGAATRCCLHKGSNYSQVYADRHSLSAVLMPSTFHVCLYFLLRKQTRRGSFDQRAALPGNLSIPNRSGANRSLLRFMRLHLSHWVLMMRTLKSLRGRIVPNLTPVSTMLQTDPGTVGDQG